MQLVCDDSGKHEANCGDASYAFGLVSVPALKTHISLAGVQQTTITARGGWGMFGQGGRQ